MRIPKKKTNHFIKGIACLGILLLWSTCGYAKAEELPDIATESAEIDLRPDYVLYVNKALNCVTVKQQNADGSLTPVKSILCSCGKEGHETPEGTFHTTDYYEWRQMVDATYGRYAVRFNRKILFHSVPYVEPSPDSLKWEEFNKLGQSASLGCVRMAVKDAKWIFDNCKPGTTVVVYSDDEEVIELGTPTAILIDENSPSKLWDPTDTDSDNPWINGQEETSAPPTEA